MSRVFSGIQPTGAIHLGNFLGAVQNWVAMQDSYDAVYCVVDLHALTTPQDPTELREGSLRLAQMLLAAGIDPQRSTLFIQSHVHEHPELAWMLECTAAFGELRRMVQFKDKSEQAENGSGGFVSAGLFTYPALMAADILLYDTNAVPVGDDQRQHLELTRDVAERFNGRYGETFVIPEAFIPPTGARIMDLQHPTNKMSKSGDTDSGTILLLDDLKKIEKKIKRAVTDTDSEVRFDIAAKPGVSNLLSILGAVTDQDPAGLASGFEQYGPLKAATAEAVIEKLRPIQERYNEFAADPAETQRILASGAEKAQEKAAEVLARAKDNIGLLKR